MTVALTDRIRRRPMLVAAIVALLIVVVIGVGIVVVANPFAAKAPTTGETTWQSITDKIRDGHASKEVALQAFAYAYDIDIPGVQVPSGVDGTDVPDEGTLVASWVRQYWDQLTPDQQAAINPYLQPGPNDTVITIDLRPPGSSTNLNRNFAYQQMPARPRPQAAPQDAPADAFQIAFRIDLLAAIAHIGERLGMSTISDEVGFFAWSEVTLDFSEKDGGNTYFETNGSESGFGYSPCNITVYRNSWQGQELVGGKIPDQLHVQLTHEVVHCYQNTVWGSNAIADSIPAWIKEGTAIWLAADDTKLLEPLVASQWRDGYFYLPERPLTNRTYDAYGYYALLDHLGRDMWGSMKPAWQAAAAAAKTPGQSSSNAFIDVLDGDAPDVRNAWAPSYLRDNSWGDPWIAYGFGLPDDAQATRRPIEAYPAPGYLGELDSRSNAVDEVQASAGEIVLIQTDGLASVRDNVGNWNLAFQSAKYCVEGDCICPPDTLRAGERVAQDRMTIPFVLAVNAPSGGAKYRVVGRKLRDECGPKEDDAYPSPNDQTGDPLCGNGCAGSNGDPHLRTVNNVYYEFQAAGEFTLLRSPDSSLEIQARQEPYEGSDHVSINTAVVAKDNGHKVGVYFTGSDLVAHVDGVIADVTTTVDLGNGAQISHHERGFEIEFPDGTQLWALSHESYGIDVQLRPSEGLRQDGKGLLGPVVPGGLPVPKLPDGTRLPRGTNAAQQHQLIYENLANAWRVTAASSLFDYDTEETTADYPVMNFPSELTATSPADLTDDQRSQAAGACSDTTDLGLLEQCIFDVSVTGDDGFATVYAAIGELISQGPGTLDLPIDGGPTPGPTPTPGPPSSAGPTATPVAAPTNAVLTGLRSVMGSAVGPDLTLYLSVANPDGTFNLVAVDPVAGSVLNQVDAQGGGQLAVAAGSVWAGEFAGGSDCSITRLDASTLAVQATIPTPCDFIGTVLSSTGDAVWYLDRTVANSSVEGVRRIDPATNTATEEVDLPFFNGFLYGTPSGLVYGEVSSGWYRLPVGQSELQSLGTRGVPVFAAGDGIWNQNRDQQVAEFFNSDGPATQSIPIDGPLVSADDSAVYVEQSSTVDFSSELWRYPIDGSDPVLVAGVPEPYGDKTFSYFDNDPLLVVPGGLVKVWMAFATPTSESALFAQWIATAP